MAENGLEIALSVGCCNFIMATPRVSFDLWAMAQETGRWRQQTVAAFTRLEQLFTSWFIWFEVPFPLLEFDWLGSPRPPSEFGDWELLPGLTTPTR